MGPFPFAGRECDAAREAFRFERGEAGFRSSELIAVTIQLDLVVRDLLAETAHPFDQNARVRRSNERHDTALYVSESAVPNSRTPKRSCSA
jgi:hypothetical protein